METIKTAIIAFGKSAARFHAPFLHVNSGFQICKVLERHRQESLKRYSYVEVIRDLESILDDPEIELAVVTSPNPTHYDIASQLLDAGKHVIMEKPFTVTVEEAEKLKKLADKNGRILSPFHNRRWDGDFRTVKNIHQEQMLGEIVEFETHFDRFRPEIGENWREKDAPGSGVLYDLGPHLVDQVLQLFGMPKSIYADVRKQRKNAVTDDYFDLELYYHGFKAILKAGMVSRIPGPRYLIHGTKGSFRKEGLDPQEDRLKNGELPGLPDWGVESAEQWGHLDTSVNGLHYKGRLETVQSSYMAYFDGIYDSIVKGKTAPVTAEEGIQTMKIIHKAMESSELGRKIEIT